MRVVVGSFSRAKSWSPRLLPCGRRWHEVPDEGLKRRRDLLRAEASRLAEAEDVMIDEIDPRHEAASFGSPPTRWPACGERRPPTVARTRTGP